MSNLFILIKTILVSYIVMSIFLTNISFLKTTFRRLFKTRLTYMGSILILMYILSVLGSINIEFIYDYKIFFIRSIEVLVLLSIISVAIQYISLSNVKLKNKNIIFMLLITIYSSIAYLAYHYDNYYLLRHQSLPSHLFKAKDLLYGIYDGKTPSYTIYPFSLLSYFYVLATFIASNVLHGDEIILSSLISFTSASIFLIVVQIWYIYCILYEFTKREKLSMIFGMLSPLFTTLFGMMNESFTYTPRGLLYVLFIALIYYSFHNIHDIKKSRTFISFTSLMLFLALVNMVLFSALYTFFLYQFIILFISLSISLFILFTGNKNLLEVYLLIISFIVTHTYEAVIYLLMYLIFIAAIKYKLSSNLLIIAGILTQLASSLFFIYGIEKHEALYIPIIPSFLKSFVPFEIKYPYYVDPFFMFYGLSLFSFTFYLPVILLSILSKIKYNENYYNIIVLFYASFLLFYAMNFSEVTYGRYSGAFSIIIFIVSSLLLLVSKFARKILVLFLLLILVLLNFNFYIFVPLINFKHPIGPEMPLIYDFDKFYRRLNDRDNYYLISSDINGAYQIYSFYDIPVVTLKTVMPSLQYDITEFLLINRTEYIYNFFSYFSLIGRLGNNSVILLFNSRSVAQYNLPDIRIDSLNPLNVIDKNVLVNFYYHRGFIMVIDRPTPVYGFITYIKNLNDCYANIRLSIFYNGIDAKPLYSINFSTLPHYDGYVVKTLDKPLVLLPGKYYTLLDYPPDVLSAWSTISPHNYFEIINNSLHFSPRKFIFQYCTSIDVCEFYLNHILINSSLNSPHAYVYNTILYYISLARDYTWSKYNIIIVIDDR